MLTMKQYLHTIMIIYIYINSDPYLHSQELTPVFNYSLNKWVNKTRSKTI